LAIKRTSSNSLVNATKMSTGFSSAAIPNAPTIGTATATSDVAATVEYTAAVLGATGTTFTATSNPSSITGTGSSPITVTGLTASTSYTFTVTAGNANGTSAASSASNSITTNAPSGSYESIATGTGSGTNTLTFSSIPATFTHLQLRYIARSTGSGDFRDFDFTINGSTSYKSHYLQGNGSAASASIDAGGTTAIRLGLCPASAMTSGVFSVGVIDILDYKDTNKNTTVRALVGVNTNNVVTERITFLSGLYLATTAVTSVTFTLNIGNFETGSQFALYGIKGA
jgi:hypothetical protein